MLELESGQAYRNFSQLFIQYFTTRLNLNFSSKLVEKAVDAFATLPGIGRKSALRQVLHLLKQDQEFTEKFTTALQEMRDGIKVCATCHNISDSDICTICADPRREAAQVCVVESIRDIMAIEDTGQYRGMYHVLGGLIAPIEGIGPDQLNFPTLIERVQTKGVKEIIMAISPTIEGEATSFYLARKMEPLGVKVSAIARGVAFGGELEYADELTLGRSIMARTPYRSR